MDDFRKKLHRQLQRHTLLDKVLEQGDITVWATDLDGEILLCEGSDLRDHGIKPDDLVGSRLNGHKVFPARWEDAMTKVMGGSVRVSYIVDRGERQVVESYAPMRSPSGRVVGIIALSTPVELE